MMGSAASAKLSIDGSDVARFRARERLDVYVKPGNHIFGIVPYPNLGALLVEESFNIVAEKHYYFRISVSSTGVMAIQPSTHLN